MKSRVIFENEQVHQVRLAYPSVMLQPYIEYYFEIDNRGTGNTFGMSGLPSANTLLSFPLTATAWASYSPGNTPVQHFSSSRLLGHLTIPHTSIYAPDTHLFFIKLKPGIASMLFRCNPLTLENAQPDLSSLLHSPVLEAQLITATTFAQRVKHAENHLYKKFQYLAIDDPKFQLVRHCIRQYASLQLNNEKGMAYLCSSLHVTYPSLRRYFLSTLGITPKFVQKTIRFRKALQQYKMSGYNFYYEDFGYTDFSHFVKDARALTGKSPLEL